MLDPNKVTTTYDLIKNIENEFPIPKPVETVTVGSFDMNTGKYTGLETEVEGYGSSATRIPPIARINAVGAKLQFDVVNMGMEDFLTVTVGDQEETIDASDKVNSVTIDVGPATQVQWKARSRSRSWKGDQLIIERPPIVGAGVFTIPALPVAIVYAPPADNPKNKATYSITQSVGTKLSTSFSQEKSTTRALPTSYDYLNRFTTIISSVASVVEKLDPSQKDVAEAMRGVASAIKSAFGNVMSMETEGSSITSTYELELRIDWKNDFETTADKGGPGRGDILYYLTNVKLVWFAYNGKVRLGLLGADEKTRDYIQVLRDDLTELKRYDCRRNPPVPLPRPGEEDVFVVQRQPPQKTPQTQTKLDCPTLEALLDLDPFVAGGEQVSLPEPRFKYLTNVGGTAPASDSLTREINEVVQTARTNYTTNVQDMHSGFLNFLGIGPSENKTVRTTFTLSSVTSLIREKTETVGYLLYPPSSGGRYDIIVYYDCLFGTLAFKRDTPRSTPVVSGRLFDVHGQPLQGELVKLVQGDKEFWTHTVEDGNYSFHSSGIEPGNLTIKVGETHKELLLEQSKHIHNVDLQLHDRIHDTSHQEV